MRRVNHNWWKGTKVTSLESPKGAVFPETLAAEPRSPCQWAELPKGGPFDDVELELSGRLAIAMDDAFSARRGQPVRDREYLCFARVTGATFFEEETRYLPLTLFFTNYDLQTEAF